MTDIMKLVEDKKIEDLALELISYMTKFKNDDEYGLVDYSYTLSKENLQIEDTYNPNTWFYFDVKKGSIQSFLKALYERELSEEEDEKVNKFIQKVATVINDHYSEQMRDIVRNKILKGSDPKGLPLTPTAIRSIDIVDYSSVNEKDRYVKHITPVPGLSVDKQGIADELMKIRDEEGDTLTDQEIVERERNSGNPAFITVKEIQEGEKYLWDVSISIFVDYSPSEIVKEESRALKV